MAIITEPFDINTAQLGVKNIWTRSGLPVVFGYYNPNATDANEVVAVWVNGQPDTYPVTGRKNGQTDDPLDLLFQFDDSPKYINLYTIISTYYTYQETLFATLNDAQTFGQNKPGYFTSIPIAAPLPNNIS